MKLWQTNKLKRINLLEGSVSSGKTWISLVLWAFWVRTMPDTQDSLYLMSARSLTTLKRNCLLPLQSLVGEDNFTFSINTKEGKLFGRTILLEGANDSQAEAKIRGLTLQGAYVDEATKVPRDFWAMLLSRLRKAKAKLFATTNPDAPSHWLKKEYIDRKGKLNMLVMKFLMDDNTTLPSEYVQSIKNEYTGIFYDRFILGLWVLAEGLIYSRYREAIEKPPEGKAEQYGLSIDYGTMNAFSAGLWGKYGDTWYRIKEYYYSGRDTGEQKTDDEYADDLDKFVKGYANEFNKIRTIIDPSAASFIALLKRKGIYRVHPADNDVKNGIIEVGRAMHQNKIKVSPDCKNTIREFEGYVWDEKAGEDKPVKVNDHAMDDIRYFVKTMKIANPKYQRNIQLGAYL